MSAITISDTELQQSAVKFQEKLLQVILLGAQETLQHLTPRPNVRGRLVVGELGGNIQLEPYKTTEQSGAVTITPRTLSTYLGSVIKQFDPNSLWNTVYGSLMTQGEALKQTNFALAMLSYMSSKIGENLNAAIFSAARNAAGTTTATLFDGFDTITAADITAGSVAAANGNYKALAAVITASNAVDALKDIYRSADPALQAKKTKMFLPFDIYNKYVDDYQSTVGAVPYNREFEKTFLEGSANRCELVPLSSKTGSSYIHLTTKSNALYGFGNNPEAPIQVDRFAPFTLTFSASMFFGVQFETINKGEFLVAKQATEPAETPTISGAASVSLGASAGTATRTYATSNGAAVNAATTSTWLEVAASGNTVTFTFEGYAYDAAAPETRTATVTISIPGTNVTKTVTVTQARAAS